MTRARRRGPSMFLDVSCHRIGQADLEFLLSSRATVGYVPTVWAWTRFGIKEKRLRRNIGARGGGGLWGHTVIFAGDRRLKVREGGFPRSRTRMVEGCTEETCCFPLFPCAWLSTCPPPESRPCGPYCLAARNSQWLSQPHRIVYANTPPQPKPLGRACVAHWNVRDQTSCGTNACCSADHLPCRTPL